MKVFMRKGLSMLLIVCIVIAGMVFGTPGTANAATATAITIMTNQPQYTMSGGFGTNLSAMNGGIIRSTYNTYVRQVVNHEASDLEPGSSYCVMPSDLNDARYTQLLNLMNWSGLDWVRLLIEQNDYEPTDGGFTWNSENFSRAKKFLDWAQAHGVDIFLQQQDSYTTWNNAITWGTDQQKIHSGPANLDKFANGFATMVDYLINTCGYTCIKLVNIANEPENFWGWFQGANLTTAYQKTRAAMDGKSANSYRLRSIPLAGNEYFQGVKDGNGYPINNGAAYNTSWDANKAYLGAWESHDYAESQPWKNINGTWTLTQGNVGQRYMYDPNYPVYWGEFGCAVNDDYNQNIRIAKWQIATPSNGIDGFARWSYNNQNDIDGNFSSVQTWNTTTRSLLSSFTPTKNLYWQDGMLSRFTSKYSTVYAAASDNSWVTPSLYKSPNGNYTMIVINESLTDDASCTFNFQSLDTSKTLYKYICTPSTVEDRTSGVSIGAVGSYTISPSSKTFNDTVSANSIYVYSTYNLSATADGITEDGSYSPVSTPIALSSNPNIIDDSAVSFSSGWIAENTSNQYNSTSKYTGAYGEYYEFDFTGSNFRLYGHTDNGGGLGSVYIDGSFAGYANGDTALRRYQSMLYDSGTLSNGSHHVKVVNEGKKATASAATYITLDAIGYTSSTGGGIVIQNQSFEENPSSPNTIPGWNIWTNDGNSDAVYREAGARSGSGFYHGTHWKNSPYWATTSQIISGLANGSYTVSAWVLCGGGQNMAIMCAKNYTNGVTNGADQINYDIGYYGSWTQISKTFTVSNATSGANGSVEIGFFSNANSGNWLQYDDVTLTAN
jgi:hypothetical protein